jgi:hypothetical protein
MHFSTVAITLLLGSAANAALISEQRHSIQTVFNPNELRFVQTEAGAQWISEADKLQLKRVYTAFGTLKYID